eukprot:TRINITY_DN93071_c0_g1_i1.p1 TRINITY_DN93071_c0_g1~~TRINITY_DN93071_c0_g1_i1.p1  ORF type:complete len:724 (-),score=125.32 TRINITY_DN93071_c0_g1_i1:45-2216(-)
MAPSRGRRAGRRHLLPRGAGGAAALACFAVPLCSRPGLVQGTTLLGEGAELEICKALRVALRRAANAAYEFYNEGTPTGATRQTSGQQIRVAVGEALKNATEVLQELEKSEGGFDQCLPNSTEDLDLRAAVGLSRGFLMLLLQPARKVRDVLKLPDVFGEDVYGFLDPKVSWARIVRSGWPVFRLASVIEHEIREPQEMPLSTARLFAPADHEDCTEEQEGFLQAANLYSGEGRTVKFLDMRDFFRNFLAGDEKTASGPRFILDILFGDSLEPSRCPAALATAFATLADSFQCHWYRPRSTQMHDMMDAAMHRAQRFALEAFGSGGGESDASSSGSGSAAPMAAMFTSRWPIIQFMARLEAPSRNLYPWRRQARGEAVAVVSWSTREAELGGENWAEMFAREVFGGRKNVQLRADVECADIYIFRSKVPMNYGGVLIFVDGETCPEESDVRDLLAGYPASIVLGPISAGGRSVHFPVPYASTSFAHRNTDVPADLTLPRPRAGSGPPSGKRRFAAYLAFKCWPHRERFYNLLDEASRDRGLGGVDALSRCGRSSVSETDQKPKRYGMTYMDDAADLFSGYRFALVFENRITRHYVTEKIVNAFLGGTVPIYWGSPFVNRIFNPRAFINVNNFPSFEAAVEYILEVATNEQLYEQYLSADILNNYTDGRRLFSWHRRAPPLPHGVTSLREELAALALEKHHAGLGGEMSAVQRRPWDYLDLFDG